VQDHHIEPAVPADAEPLAAFLHSLGGADQTFLSAPMDDPDVAHRVAAGYATQADGLYLVARIEPGSPVVGFAGVTPGAGWSAHVGQLRVVVDPGRRGTGLGAHLAMTALTGALEQGLEKIVVEVRSDQDAVLGLFGSLGFQPEALLTNQLRDPAGDYFDLITLAHSRRDIEALVAATGLSEVGAG